MPFYRDQTVSRSSAGYSFPDLHQIVLPEPAFSKKAVLAFNLDENYLPGDLGSFSVLQGLVLADSRFHVAVVAVVVQTFQDCDGIASLLISLVDARSLMDVAKNLRNTKNPHAIIENVIHDKAFQLLNGT